MATARPCTSTASLKYLFFALIVTETPPIVLALNNGLALTPPMGYNTWNAFHDEINETLIFHAADELVESGLTAAGYIYLIIDGRTLLLATHTTLAQAAYG